MAIEISSSGSDVVGTRLNVEPLETSSTAGSLFVDFEVDETLTWIKDNSFARIALQFPEELFHVSSLICLELQRKSSDKTSYAVLAEKKYGSCCVDEIGAEHFAADCLIHYGQACLSPHPRLPVKYVFARRSIDVEDFVTQVKSTKHLNCEKELTLIYDLSYHYQRDKMFSCLKSSGMKFHCPEILAPSERDSLSSSGSSSEMGDGEVILGRRFRRGKDDEIQFVYVGSDDSFLTTMMTIFNRSAFILYVPEAKSLSSNLSRNSKMFMKRYYMMEKARDSQFVGILVGTLDVSGYADVIERIKSASHAAGKKCRTYSPGTLNPAKLANLPEFDAYVLVACPLNTFVDSYDYYQPIVTPYEMILACSSGFRWSTDYKIAFDGVLSEPIDESHQEPSTDVSLLTGRVIKIGVSEEDKILTTDGMLMRCPTSDLIKPSGSLQSRTWYGLQPRLGETPVSKFIEGSVGIASGYQHENNKTRLKIG